MTLDDYIIITLALTICVLLIFITKLINQRNYYDTLFCLYFDKFNSTQQQYEEILNKYLHVKHSNNNLKKHLENKS